VVEYGELGGDREEIREGLIDEASAPKSVRNGKGRIKIFEIF
jgi:hypothetical protein